jgi:outer membrane protein TolC
MNEQAIAKSQMKWRVVAGAMLGAALLAGCVDHSRDVARYRKLLDGATPATQPAFDSAADLSLVRAVAIANADNEAIASSGEDYIQALADKMRQAGNFLPTLSLGPSYALSHSSDGGGGGFVITGGGGTGSTVQTTGDRGGTTHRLSVPANASIQGSLQNAANLKAAGQTVQQRAQLLLDERETILLQVVQAYYNVLRSEQQTAVYENSVTLRAEQVRDQEARVKIGGARPLDLAQSQAQLASTRVSLTQSRTDAANARSALARLMGISDVTGTLTDAFVPPTTIAPLQSWEDQALAQRQDYLAMAREVESARLGVRGAIEQYFPSVSINFNYYLYNDPKSSQRWSGGISANIPIFSALQIEADVRRAWSVYRQAGLSQSQKRRQVMDEIIQAYQNWQNSRSKIVDLRVQVTAAQRAVDLAERGYQLGSETNLDRLVQQDSLLTAQLNLLTEQFNEKTNYLSLLRAAGQLATVLPGK